MQVLPRENPVEEDAVELAAFLRQEADGIARLASRAATTGLPVGGTGARRRLRALFREQIVELARFFETYGADETPRLYGESQRRYAAARLAQGMTLADTLEERAIVQEAVFDACAMRWGQIPASYARMVAGAFSEVTSQTAEVWLTYQRSEAAAFQEAALLETIVHHLDEAILVVEPDATVSYATPRVEEILGLPARLFVGVPSERMQGLLQKLDFRDENGEPIEAARLPHRVAIRTRTPQRMDAVRVKRMDGSEAVVELGAVPVSDEDGALRGVVVTLRDRTRAFEQTAALQAAYDDLRSMHARLLARSRLEAIGELAKSAAHALNNQLNVIALRLRRLLEQPESVEEAKGIERSVREIAGVVSRLQEFAAAPPQGTPVPVDVEGLVSESLDMVRAELGAGTAVSVRTRLDQAGEAMAERETLLEFLTTLLLGARDATPAGEAVEVETATEGAQAVIRVLDRGPTLTAEQIENVFEPLAPGAATRALPLSMGRQAVLRWGGDVRIRPRAGGGNLFEIRLPLRAAQEERAPVVQAPAPAPAPQAEPIRRVLVVDDDADNAGMLAEMIRDAEASATTANSGADAIRRAEATRPQAALVDLLLPDMKGWEVVKALKERIPGIRVAVVSGLAVGREEREQGGADAVFRKPIDTDEILKFLGL